MQISVDIDKFSKDHWSLLAYIHSLQVDSGNGAAVPQLSKMRCNRENHPEHFCGNPWMDSYGTRLSNGKVVPGHDDWNCIDDMERAGLITTVSSANRAFSLTDTGYSIVEKLLRHKAAGNNFASFIVQ